MKIIYDGFKYDDISRMNEIWNTLKWNSKIFDEIVIICNSDQNYDAYSWLNGFNNVIKIIRLDLSEITIQNAFQIANRLFGQDTIKCYATLDCIFTDGCKSISVPDDTMLLLTDRNSYEIESQFGEPIDQQADGLKIFNKDGILDENKFVNYNLTNLDSNFQGRWLVSNSAWIWKSIKPIDGTTIVGNVGAENTLLYYIRIAGYKIQAGGLKYKTYHNHNSNNRTNRRQVFDSGPKSYVVPSEVLI
jgi:hypothetical protein